jgi:hypothetical protein
MKIYRVGAEFLADARKERFDEAKVAFGNFANAPKNAWTSARGKLE